ncbi:MAG TPA: phospholipase D family protein [Chthonomonadaceae bacterium]|nr:phospholipase D family protein [Chthonomonadaceae bacterium]
MPSIEFVMQGLTTRTHAAAVRELFDVPDVESVLLSVAYVTESGVQQIEEQLSSHANRLSVFAGIRNEVTSVQAMRSLRAIEGANVYAVDTGSRNVVFHPKVFLVRGKRRARLIVGSANLTLGGLNNNIEAGLMLELDRDVTAEQTIVDRIESEILSLPERYPANVMAAATDEYLERALADGRLVDEMALSPPKPTASERSAGARETVPQMGLLVPRIRRPFRIPGRLGIRRRLATGTTQGRNRRADAAKPVAGLVLDLVWESKPLTRRDLTIPDNQRTHATGSMNLDQGLLPAGVDFRHYFRNEVFQGLRWMPRAATVDEAYGKFQLVLKNVSYGEFDLAVRHTNSTTTPSYAQKNAMTRLSWGPAREYVAREDLIGRTLALFRDHSDTGRFVLDID